VPDGQITCGVPPCASPALDAKIFRFALTPNQIYNWAVLPTEGRIMIVTYAGWDAVDAAASGVKWNRRAGLP